MNWHTSSVVGVFAPFQVLALFYTTATTKATVELSRDPQFRSRDPERVRSPGPSELIPLHLALLHCTTKYSTDDS